MKKVITAVLLFLVCIFSLAACGGKSDYVIATDNAYQPFCYTDTSGKTVGFDVDIIKAVAKVQNIKIKIVSPGYIEAFEALGEGEADGVIAAVIPDSENCQKYDFSNFYYNDEYAFAVLKGENSELLGQFNAGLEKIIENGTYKKIYDRYFEG